METLLRYLEKLRREPVEKRRRAAFWVSIFLFLLILGLWFLGQGTAVLLSRIRVSPAQSVGAVPSSQTGVSGFWSEQWLRIKQGWQVISQ